MYSQDKTSAYICIADNYYLFMVVFFFFLLTEVLNFNVAQFVNLFLLLVVLFFSCLRNFPLP